MCTEYCPAQYSTAEVQGNNNCTVTHGANLNRFWLLSPVLHSTLLQRSWVTITNAKYCNPDCYTAEVLVTEYFTAECYTTHVLATIY